MCHTGFADGKNIESHLEELLMIENISAVKDKGWFVHGLIYLFKIETSIQVPLGHYCYSMTAISRLVWVFDIAYFSVHIL